MNMQDKIGSLAPGLLADIVAFDGNPLDVLVEILSDLGVIRRRHDRLYVHHRRDVVMRPNRGGHRDLLVRKRVK